MSKNTFNILSKFMIIILALSSAGCAAALIGAGAAAGTAAAVGTDSRGGEKVVSDQVLVRRVNNVLDAQVPNGSFTIASHNQKVLLAGQVSSQEEKDKAETAVINTAGVKKVWNYLTISVNETVGDISHDTYLTSLAKSRLIGQKHVNTNNIKVVTCNNVVYLLGDRKAGDKVQIDGAVAGINDISGVKNVVNLIQITPN
ncbi:MAG: hemolysin [Burkholderiales bacterium]|jgi:osmotically-inducible protein OsmY|nr:hemolysin [Burkholderiales bacterium]